MSITSENVAPTRPISRLVGVNWWIRETVAGLVWLFAFIKLFIFDLDNYVVSNYAPTLAPALNYRFAILLGSVAVLWLLLRRDRFRVFILYVAFYPFVFFLWRIPRLVFRNWVLAVAFFPAIYSAIRTFRRNFIFGALAFLAFLVVLNSESATFLAPAAGILLLFLCVHFFERFRMAFIPSSVLADLGKIAQKVWGIVHKSGLDEPAQKISELNPKDPNYESQKQGFVVTSLTLTILLQVLATKLRTIAGSRMLDLYLILAVLYTVLLTVVLFAAEYVAIEKIAPTSFTGNSGTGYWQFLGYSFTTLMAASISDIRATSTAAQLMSYVELSGSILIFVIACFSVGVSAFKNDFLETACRSKSVYNPSVV